MIKAAAKRVLPAGLYREIARRRYRLRPSPLDPWRRLVPVAPEANARGRSIDRCYIEAFLGEHAPSITGTTLEIGDDSYTRAFGCNVTRSDVLNDPRSGSRSGIVGDLRRRGTLVPNTYDCVILTQTLQFIDDPAGALEAVHDALTPGGVALITVPGIAQISSYDDRLWGDYYRWTVRGLTHLLALSAFRLHEIRSYGNVLAATAFLHHLAIDELTPDERAYRDDDYPLIVACVATK